MSNEYPRESELEQIKNWDYKLGFKSLFEFIEGIWWMPDWGFKLYKGRDNLLGNVVMKLQLHTGGWSGNESIMDALGQNFIFYSTSFWKQYRGGHYYFQIPMFLWKETKRQSE
jgi:hypothetical protein